MRVKDRHLQQVLDGQAYLLFDGAMGTMMQAAGLLAGELPELLRCRALGEAEAAARRVHRDPEAEPAREDPYDPPLWLYL